LLFAEIESKEGRKTAFTVNIPLYSIFISIVVCEMVGFNDMRTEGTIFPTWSTHIAL
jgi:hypothetical protein